MHVHDQRQMRRRHAATGSRERGFTLIEIMVVLLIVALAVLIALPNMRRVTVRSGATSALNSVVGPFNLARAEAVKRHSPICVLYEESDRMITVFEDWDVNNDALAATNRNGILDGNEETIVSKPFPSGLLAYSGTQISKVIYRTDGSLDTLASVPTNGGVASLIDKSGNQFQVRINGVTGMVTVEGQTPAGTWSTVKEAWEWKY